MRVLVTGGAGFIGSNLVDRLLAEDCDVDVVDDLSSGSLPNLADARSQRHRRCSFHRLDVSVGGVEELMAHRKPEIVYHLAAQKSVTASVADPGYDALVNIVGSLHVLQGAVAAGTRKLVFAGSGGTLYGVAKTIPTPESHPTHPVSPYGVSKLAVADYLHYYRDQHNLSFTVLALANVYGPRQDPDGEAGVVAIFSKKVLAKVQPTIYGDGEQTRDYLYVDDAVDAFVRATEKGGGLLVNIGTGTATTVHDLYDRIAALTGYAEAPHMAPARMGDLEHSCLDPGRAAIHLGWKPWTSLDEGLARTVDWFRAPPQS